MRKTQWENNKSRIYSTNVLDIIKPQGIFQTGPTFLFEGINKAVKKRKFNTRASLTIKTHGKINR